MQSSFNVIKNSAVISQGNKEITTNFIRPKDAEIETNIKNNIESYENLALSIMENARRQGEAILSKAYNEAQKTEEEAFQKASILQKEAFEKGYSEGKEEGSRKAYEDTIVQVSSQYENMKENVNNLLLDSKRSYEAYLEDKKQEINNFIIMTIENILKKEVKDKSGITAMVFDALSQAKNAKSFIIRCNPLYTEELTAQINSFKEQLAFKGDIFVIKDNLLDEGIAVIDKGNGKITVATQIAIQKIIEILEENEKDA